MSNRHRPGYQNAWAKAARQRLLDELGGACALCGSGEDLEIDHPAGVTYDPAKLSSSQRVSRYRAEARAGTVRVLCSRCNGSDGNFRAKRNRDNA